MVLAHCSRAPGTGGCSLHSPHAPSGSEPPPARGGWVPRAAQSWRHSRAWRHRASPAPSGHRRLTHSLRRRQPATLRPAAGRHASAATATLQGRQRLHSRSRCLCPSQILRMAGGATASPRIRRRAAAARCRLLAPRRQPLARSPAQTAASSCRRGGPARTPAPRSCSENTSAACWGPVAVAAGWQAAAAAAAPGRQPSAPPWNENRGAAAVTWRPRKPAIARGRSLGWAPHARQLMHVSQ